MTKPLIRASILSAVGLCAALASATLWVRPRADAADGKAPGAAVASRPSSTPATQTTAPRRAVPPMPKEFQVLLKRSVFAKSGKAGSDEQPEGSKSAVELQYVLRGVASQEGAFVAFVENTSNSRLMRLHAGDTVARGKLSRISFGGVDYKSAAGMTRVAIGCALDGVPRASADPSDAPTTQDAPDSKAARKRKKSRDGQSAEPTTAVLSEDATQKVR